MATSVLTFNNRLPGVDCQPALPPTGQPIRLDVAGFVGLAERGPLDLPVPVEDINQYATIFGGDLLLATDDGVPVYANLPSAVRSFFDNGGRRCYVVRVAGAGAVAGRWRVPGLASCPPGLPPEDVYVDAAWVGRWSGGMTVGTQLLQQPIAVTGPYLRADAAGPGVFPVDATTALAVQNGDIIQLDLGPALPGLYLSVAGVTSTIYGWEIAAGAEIPFQVASGEQLLDAGALTGLPAQVDVIAAYLLRLDLVMRQSVGGAAPQQLERWHNLRFNPSPVTSGPSSAAFWLDVLQPADGAVPPPAPDLTRSLLLRADGAPAGVYVPVDMDQLGTAEEFAAPAVGSLPDDDTPGDDGLASFDPVALFLDPNLESLTVFDLIAAAEQLTSLSTTPIQLHGIHALVPIEEVALISVPDAAQRTWSPSGPAPSGPPAPPPPAPLFPNWSLFRPCATAPVTDPAPAGPVATPLPNPDPPPSLDPIAFYQVGPLLQVQQGVVTLCAARADAFAVLSVPHHFTTDDVLQWRQELTLSGRISGAPLSYGGYWHPWLQIVEPTTPQLARLRAVPSDGTACGTIATRENDRGVWLAPANVAIRGAVGLSPTMPAAATVALFNGHANLFVSEPGKYVALCAHTLSDDASLLQVSIRRLLILIRKIALRRGMRYVFEPNTDRFRSLVRLSFERLLTEMQDQGAFVDFQVDTSSGVNTPEGIANGELVVALRIAPTNPIEFITITMVRSGEGLLDVVEG